MKTKLRKFMATVMAMVMMIAMTALPVSADTGFHNLTTAGNTDYTTQITSTTDYTAISVQKIADDWITKAAFSSDEVGNVSWTWPNGGASNFVVNATTTPVVENGVTNYYATLNVKKADLATPGAYSVRATWTYDTGNSLYATMDLTLVIPGSGGSANVKVYIDGENTAMDNYSFTVTNPSVTADAGTYQYATPASALEAMKTAGNISNYVLESSGYISSITKSEGQTKTASGWYGWQYRVYHYDDVEEDYIIYPTSLYLSASTFKLSNDDIVAWYYGPYDNSTTIHFDSYDFDAIFAN